MAGKLRMPYSKQIAVVLCIAMVVHAGMAGNSVSAQAYVVQEEQKQTGTAASFVKSHKQFVSQLYKMALKRESPGVFYCNGNGSRIFDGDLDKLLAEICAIDKSTSDDADYLANSVASMNMRTKQEYRGNQIQRTEYTVQIRYRESAKQLMAVNTRVQEVLEELEIKGQSDYKKVKAIHDYIVNNTRYQLTTNGYSAYGALMEGKAVCQGYAQLAYKMLLEAGVKCYVITGIAGNGWETQSHAWNMVKVGGKWYYLDVTWDDPIGSGDMLEYDYFLLGKKQFEKSHAAAEEYSKKIKKVRKQNHKKWKELQ